MDVSDYLRFLLSLIFVIGLIGLCGWAGKKYGLGTRLASGQARDKRLSIVESIVLDGKRRLLLIRRDDREHLILIGGESDLVIENGIAAAFSEPQAACNADLPRQPGVGAQLHSLVSRLKERSA